MAVLDVMLPDMSGTDLCRRMRREERMEEIPVLFVTAKTEEADKLEGFRVGADDYLTKPFSPRELIARIHALLRRPRMGGVLLGVRTFGDLVIDPDSREVRIGGREVELTPIEFDLLDTLSSRPHMAFSRALLLERIWGEDHYGDDHVVDVHIADLRKKLGDDPRSPRFIRTVRGVGYGMANGDARARSSDSR